MTGPKVTEEERLIRAQSVIQQMRMENNRAEDEMSKGGWLYNHAEELVRLQDVLASILSPEKEKP
jgi:hypothetical protein